MPTAWLLSVTKNLAEIWAFELEFEFKFRLEFVLKLEFWVEFVAEFMVFVEFRLEFVALCEFAFLFVVLAEFAFVSSTPITRGFKFASGLKEFALKFIIQNPLCIKC